MAPTQIGRCNRHGAISAGRVRFEELDGLDEEAVAAFRDRALTERVAHWIAALAAAKI
jgi:hypothetical protein